MALRVLCEKMMDLDRSLTAVFIDYRVAFHSVSHKYVDTALKRVGDSAKVRSMYRVIYKTTAAYTEVTGADSKKIRCDNFNIGRVVLQGVITSPLFFFMGLEMIMRCHDTAGGFKQRESKWLIRDTLIHVLGYADDVVILEDGTPAGQQQAAGIENQLDLEGIERRRRHAP